MSITAKFNLEMTQIDAVNAFIHYNLDEVIYIKLLPGFNKGKEDKILYLKKSSVWTTMITTIMAEESYKFINRIGFQRGTLKAMCYAKR